MYGTIICDYDVWDMMADGVNLFSITLSRRRKPMCGRVEVVSIPPPMTLQVLSHSNNALQRTITIDTHTHTHARARVSNV